MINPPYSAANNMKKKANTEGLSKGTSDTKVKKLMQDTKAAQSGQNLYNQFVYRIYNIGCLIGLDKLHLGIFCPTQIHTGRGNIGLRSILGNFWIKEMFMLQASQFADVKGNWSIGFSVFDNLENVSREVKCIAYDFIDGTLGDGIVKNLYNLDNVQDAAKWIREPDKKKKTALGCQLSSALNIGKGNSPLGMVTADHIGYCVMDGNNIDANASQVYLLSTSAYHGHGVSVTRDDFDRVVSLFAAHKLISGDFANWINCKDEYMIPDISNPKYEEWQNDSIVYSLFNTGSQQSSLRDIEYNGRTWDIQNEFFWMSSDIIEKLADGSLIKRLNDNRYQNSEVLDDLEKFGDHERYVYLRLKELKGNNKLSAEALAVLTKAEDLVLSSFKYRKDFNERHPEYQINTWDAGWYQIKGMLKDYDKEGLKEFNSLYDTLANKMRPLVYELGFLYK